MQMLLVLCAALALTVGVATVAAGGGNSENAKKCQKGGWQTLVRQDGSSFKNQGECVSHAAQGGTLTAKTKSQLDCEAIGGMFAKGKDGVIWTCNDWPYTYGSDAAAKLRVLTVDCGLDGGKVLDSSGDGVVADARCSSL
jgi:hypothetical protein